MKITLFKHITDGGAEYLTDAHRFADAKIIIRLDGGAELLKCEAGEEEEEEEEETGGAFVDITNMSEEEFRALHKKNFTAKYLSGNE